MPVYLGPYNDPLDTTGAHHWDTPHASDCRNAAISVTRAGGAFTIAVAVENSDVLDSTGNTITLYASYRTRPFARPSDVDTYIVRSIFGAAVPPVLAPSPWNNQTVSGRSSLGDNPWRPPGGAILWTPSLTPPSNAIVIIVLTVQGATPAVATQDSRVAVWVGP